MITPVMHDAAGPCEPDYHRAMPDGTRCRCGQVRPADHDPDNGHTFRISVDSRGSYMVVGDEHHSDAGDFHGIPHVLEIRAWDLPAALAKAAALPLSAWHREGDE